jgi:hypothetical protein
MSILICSGRIQRFVESFRDEQERVRKRVPLRDARAGAAPRSESAGRSGGGGRSSGPLAVTSNQMVLSP